MTKHDARKPTVNRHRASMNDAKSRPVGRSLNIAITISLLAVGITLSLATGPAVGQGRASFTPEQKVKAVYLYNFTRYVQWPAKAFPNKEAPFVIGILKDDPHGRLLDRIATTRKAQGRSITVKRFDSVESISGCHLVFLNAGVGAQAEQQTIERTQGEWVLLIGDSVAVPQNGIPIRFFYDANGTIGLQINVDSMMRRELKADAKLLKIATIVQGQ